MAAAPSPLSASLSKESDLRFHLDPNFDFNKILTPKSLFSRQVLTCFARSLSMDKPELGNDVVESPSMDGQFEMRNYSQLGGTENDERDMQMLGRTQQLNVRPSPSLPSPIIDNHHSATSDSSQL